MNLSRLAVAVAALPLLAACSVTVPIDVAQEVALEAPAAGPFSVTEAVDLASSGGSFWSERGRLDGVSVDEVTATVTSLAAGAGATLGLTLAFRPEGAPADGSQDVAIGTISDLPLAVGQSATLAGSAALDELLLSVVKGSGQFTAVAGGSVSAPVSAILSVRVKGSATSKIDW